jgi:hypothetical protein
VDSNPTSAGARAPRGDATVAALLTWFVPGAGHLLLGDIPVALLGFGIVGGLYALGLSLSGGMTFEYLDPELRGALAPLLSPEAGNLGGWIWQLRNFGYGPGHPRLFPDTVRLGSALCAVSGVANVMLMIHAHLFARTGSRRTAWRPAALVGCAWAVPGLGHWLQGRRLRAAIVCGLLLGLFAVGTLLADASNLSRERHFYYWAGQFLLGLPVLAAEGVWGATRVTGPIPYAEAGLVYGCVAGLLNVLAMIDVYGWAEAKAQGLDPLARGAPPAASPQPAEPAS